MESIGVSGFTFLPVSQLATASVSLHVCFCSCPRLHTVLDTALCLASPFLNLRSSFASFSAQHLLTSGGVLRYTSCTLYYSRRQTVAGFQHS